MHGAGSILADIAILDDDLDFRNYLEDFLKDEGDVHGARVRPPAGAV